MSSGAKHADEFSILAGEAEKTRARLIDIIAKHTRRPRAEIEARIDIYTGGALHAILSGYEHLQQE